MTSKLATKSIATIWNSVGNSFRSKSCNTSSTTETKSEQVPIKKDLVPKSLDSEDSLEVFPTLTIQLDVPMKTSLISGLPEDMKNRLVKISKPPKNAMQSGTNALHHWQVTFDTKERWENPLMGWSSVGDPLSNLKLTFSTKEKAVDFCDRNGWKWFATENPPKKKKRSRAYSENFVNKRTRVSTK